MPCTFLLEFQNVFVTGGCASFINLKQRLERDLQQMCPFKSHFTVNIAEQPTLDAWHGARRFAASDQFMESSISRTDYEEKGSDWLKENFLSNMYRQPALQTLPADLNVSTENDATLENVDGENE